MRRLVAVLVAVALAMLLLPDARGQARLQVAIAQDPAVLTSGSQGVLTLTVQNVGDAAASNLQFFVDDPPAGLRVEGASFTTGSVGSKETAVRSLLLTADPDLAAGRHLLQIRMQYCSVGVGTCTFAGFSQSFVLLVGHALDVRVDAVEPKEVVRSQVTNLDLLVRNPGMGEVRDVVITWTKALIPAGAQDRITIPRIGREDAVWGRAQVVATAPEGIATLNFTIKYREASGITRTTVAQVGLAIRDWPELEAQVTGPIAFARSGSANLTVQLRNPSTDPYTDVTLSWKADQDALLPLGNDGILRIPTLPGSGTMTSSLPVIVSTGAPAGAVPITVNVTYRDQAGNLHQEALRLAVVIGGKAFFDAGDATVLGRQLTVTLANIGSDGAESVVVRALDANGTVLGTTFLGQMDGGDYATLTVQLAGDAQPTQVHVAYTDESGLRREESLPVAALVVEPEDSGGGGLVWALGLAVVAAGGVGFWVWRRRRQ